MNAASFTHIQTFETTSLLNIPCNNFDFHYVFIDWGFYGLSQTLQENARQYLESGHDYFHTLPNLSFINHSLIWHRETVSLNTNIMFLDIIHCPAFI
jgi:hypothetical protein